MTTDLMYIRFGVSCIALCLGLISACDSMNTRPDIEDESTKVSIADSTFVVAADILSHIGSVVDLDAGKMILGDFVNGDLEQLSGALYVYSRSGNTWIKDATLRPFQAEANLFFGRTAEIEGNKIVVGSGSPGLAIGWPRRAGPVYLFESIGAGWNESAILTSSDVAPECYGITRKVGVSGNYLFTLTNEPGNFEKRLCLYAQAASGLIHTYLHLEEFFDPSPFVKVVVNKEEVVVLGPRDGSLVLYTFFYDGTAWHHTSQTLREVHPNGRYRSSADASSEVAVGKDLLVISLPDRLHATTSTQGMVEVYRKVSNQWVLEGVLFQSPEAEKGDFGQNIAIHVDIIVVSTKRRDATLDKFNSAEVFQHTSGGWQRVIELRAGNSAYDPAFTNSGGPVDLSNTTIVIWESTVAVGAVPGIEGLLSGVYIFELAGL